MSEFAELIGNELGPTRWLEVDQERIDRFAKAALAAEPRGLSGCGPGVGVAYR